MSATKILIVEDYTPLAETLEYQLRRAGYDTRRAADGDAAVRMARDYLPDVVFLDVDLPILSGIEVCTQIRAQPENAEALILMLSALGEETDQVVGFAVGADDYVVKPIESYKVLLQRLKAHLRRRTQRNAGDDVVRRHNVEVDRRRLAVKVDGEEVKLTKSEFKLLDALMTKPGVPMQRSELVDQALGEDILVLDRTIDVHIRALRKKMGSAAEWIETVRGFGYRFRE